MNGTIQTHEEAVVYFRELKEWEQEIKNAFENIIINLLKTHYTYIVDIADIRFDRIFHLIEELPVKVVLFMKPEYINKNHEVLDRDIKSMLEMMQLDKRDMSIGQELKIRLKVWAVSSE